jgi:hypothetical protein
MLRPECAHPEYDKVIGSLDRPHAAVVFGEKGAGKTALRLLIGKRLALHNQTHAKERVLLVGYDDLNPVLDLVARNRHGGASDPDALLAGMRLPDHQDAILGLAVTKFFDGILGVQGNAEAIRLPTDAHDRLRRLPRDQRMDAAVLAALYDSPRGGDAGARWGQVRGRLRLGWRLPSFALETLATLLSIVAVVLFLAPLVGRWFDAPADRLPSWAPIVAGGSAVVAGLCWLFALRRQLGVWNLARRIRAEAPALDRAAPQLRTALRQLRKRDRVHQPWPTPGGDGTNARYELTHRFLRLLRAFDHTGMIVLVDRVDEPTLVAGRPERMRALVWPLLESKFLQQDGVGVKLLLPIELRYLVHRESSDFFQEARLDKQSLVERLKWSGATLYDLCTARLRACHEDHRPAEGDEGAEGAAERTGGARVSLTDLFAPDVPREAIVEALGQMVQPRDAFKLLHSVIREHCQQVPDEAAEYRIPRHILENVRREQAQRVNELQRGLSPA